MLRTSHKASRVQHRDSHDARTHRCHQGPFDHPQLPIPTGDQEVAISGTQRAVTNIAVMPAVGNAGLPGKPCFPNTGNLFGDLQITFAIVTAP
jgi:hypothetical protein